MIRISNVPDWATVGSQVMEPIKASTTYSASALIKTEGVTGSGAVLKFDILDASGKYLAQKLSRVLTGTYKWIWVTVSLTDTEFSTG